MRKSQPSPTKTIVKSTPRTVILDPDTEAKIKSQLLEQLTAELYDKLEVTHEVQKS